MLTIITQGQKVTLLKAAYQVLDTDGTITYYESREKKKWIGTLTNSGALVIADGEFSITPISYNTNYLLDRLKELLESKPSIDWSQANKLAYIKNLLGKFDSRSKTFKP